VSLFPRNKLNCPRAIAGRLGAFLIVTLRYNGLAAAAGLGQHRVDVLTAETAMLVERHRHLLDGVPVKPDNPISTAERIIDAPAYSPQVGQCVGEV
jgi:hypothetical protein